MHRRRISWILAVVSRLTRLQFHLEGVKLYLTEVRNLRHYRHLSFQSQRINLSRLNKNFHIRRRLQFYRICRVEDTFNFYPKDKSFYPRSEACIAANTVSYNCFCRKKNLRKFNFSSKTKILINFVELFDLKTTQRLLHSSFVPPPPTKNSRLFL